MLYLNYQFLKSVLECSEVALGIYESCGVKMLHCRHVEKNHVANANGPMREMLSTIL